MDFQAAAKGNQARFIISDDTHVYHSFTRDTADWYGHDRPNFDTTDLASFFNALIRYTPGFGKAVVFEIACDDGTHLAIQNT